MNDDINKRILDRLYNGGYMTVVLFCPQCNAPTFGQKHNDDFHSYVRCENCRRVMEMGVQIDPSEVSERGGSGIRII